MGLLTAVRAFPGGDRVLARHAEALPQPDQLCGPFAAHVALHAVLTAPPGVTALAVAAGTRIFPSDVAEWRPAGTPPDHSGWVMLAQAATPGESGTDAVGVALGVEVTSGSVVLPVSDLQEDALAALLAALLEGPPVGVVANISTRALDPDYPFEVGHFAVLWGCSDDGRAVGLADTYAELGVPGQPAGCRVVTVAALQAGLADPPGRGLLLLTAPPHADDVRRLVEASGAATSLWAT